MNYGAILTLASLLQLVSSGKYRQEDGKCQGVACAYASCSKAVPRNAGLVASRVWPSLALSGNALKRLDFTPMNNEKTAQHVLG